MSAEADLPDGIANEVEEAYRSGKILEVFQRGTLSDICHDEVLLYISEILDPNADRTINVLVFLSKFDEVRKRLADFYGGFDRFPTLRAKAVHFRNMTTDSIANRTQSVLAAVSSLESDRKDLIQSAEFINGLAQEAKEIFRGSLAAKASRQ